MSQATFHLALMQRSLMRSLIFRRPKPSTLALLPLLCVLASCATPGVGTRQETAEALLAEARHAKDPAAQIGFALAAADKAAGNLGEMSG